MRVEFRAARVEDPDLARQKASAPLSEADIDAHVGSRIRAGRVALGYDREIFSRMLRTTVEQLTGWESGARRIGASDLYDISKLLRVPLSAFFPDLESGDMSGATNDNSSPSPSPGLSAADGLELLSIFFRIPDAESRARVVAYAAEIAAQKLTLS